MCVLSYSRLKSKYPSNFPARRVFRHAGRDVTRDNRKRKSQWQFAENSLEERRCSDRE